MKKRKIKLLSIDLGYDTVKVLTKKNKISFPSLAQKEDGGVLKNLSFDVNNFKKDSRHDKNKMIIKLRNNDKSYSTFRIGDYVLNQDISTTSYSLSEDKHNKSEELAKFLAGIAMIEPSSNNIEIDKVITGLPIKFHNKYKSDFKERFEGRFKFEFIDSDEKFVSKIIKINQVVMIPQGLASYYDFALNDKGLVASKIENGIGIIDLGGLTIDCVAFNDGELIKNSPISFNFGVRKKVFEKIQNTLSIDISQDILKKQIIQNKDFIKIRNNKYNFKKIKEETIDNLAKEISLQIENRWNDILLIDKILITGGASIMLFDKLNKYLKNFPCEKINKNPQFSNARGYLKLGKALKRKKREKVKDKIKKKSKKTNKKNKKKKSS